MPATTVRRYTVQPILKARGNFAVISPTGRVISAYRSRETAEDVAAEFNARFGYGH